MMHRYVVLIATTRDRTLLARAREQLTPHLRAWTQLLEADGCCAWSFEATPSRLRHRRVSAACCVIGADFPQVSADDGPTEGLSSMEFLSARWGAYVRISIRRESVSVLRDPTGRIECWRLSLPGLDVIFSHLDDVRELLAQPLSVNWDYLAYHLNCNWLCGEATAYTEIDEILPGQELTYRNGPPERRLAWSPIDAADRPFTSLGEARHAIRDAAEQAVGVWSGRYERVALDLSGGLDSTIVLGLLRQAGHTGVVGVNLVIPHVEGDERSYARDAATLHGVELVEQEISATSTSDTPAFRGRLLRPAIRAMSLGYDRIIGDVAKRLAADAFFTGTGGDHLFFDGLGVKAACDYRRRHGLTGDFVRTAHHLARISKNTIWAAFGDVAADWMAPRPPLSSLLQQDNAFLTPEARGAADYARFTHPWVPLSLGRVGPAKVRQILNLGELQRHYWRYGRADISEEVHPMFSQPLVEACLRTPAYWFASGGVQRGLARSIFADLLPASIRERRTKGANTSHWLQVMRRDLPQIRPLLLEGQLASRGLVDRVRLEAALTPMGLAASANMAGMVNCLTTEMWLQQTAEDMAPPGVSAATAA